MKIKILGGGGAFDTHNSSFIIKTDPFSLEPSDYKTILFDCNWETFQKYKNNEIKRIDYVFISHTHFDHISGLEQLIFYRYFIENKTTTIITGEKVKEELEYILKDCKNGLENNKIKHVESFEIKTSITIPNYDIKIFKSNHIIKDCYGLLIKDDKPTNITKKLRALIITGDTKASKNIKNILEKLLKKNYEITVFHDFSNFDDSLNNPHCCLTDYNRIYKDLIKNSKIKWYLYHNEDFDKKFYNKEIEI